MSYTDKEVATLKEAAPVTYEDAVAFGLDWGKSTQSVISKVQSLDLEYVKKEVPAKKEPKATKAQIVAVIQDSAGPDYDLSGLTGSTREALVELNAFINSLV